MRSITALAYLLFGSVIAVSAQHAVSVNPVAVAPIATKGSLSRKPVNKAQSSSGFTWTGFYVGGNFGFDSTKIETGATEVINQLTNVNPPGPQPITVVPSTTRPYAGSDRKASFLYGGVAGYQRQSASVVFGAEGDLNGSRNSARFEQSVTLPPTLLSPASTVTFVRDVRNTLDWSARGRLGYAFGEDGSNLIYFTAGVAGARVRLTASNSYFIPAGAAAPSGSDPAYVNLAQGPVVNTVRSSRDFLGWTAGGGFERRISRHWILGGEGRFSDYGSKTFDGGCAAHITFTGRCPNDSTFSSPPLIVVENTNRTQDPATDTINTSSPSATPIDLKSFRMVFRVLFRF